MKFQDYFRLAESLESLDQPHVISADPPMRLPKGLQRIANAFKESKNVPIGKEVDPKHGGEKHVTLRSKKIYLVGGAVRDYILNHTPRDYNLVTDAHPFEIVKICEHAEPPIKVLSKTKSSVHVESNGEKYEIETMNKGVDHEGNPAFVTDPKLDSEKRDITANALYYDIVSHKIFDYVGGIKDMKNKVVKLLDGAKSRLGSDHKLPFKVARFAAKMKADTDSKTKKAVKDFASKCNEPDLEKIKDEFEKSRSDSNVDFTNLLKLYSDLGLSNIVFPGAKLATESVPSNLPTSKVVTLASMMNNLHPSKVKDLLSNVGMPESDVRGVLFLMNLPKINNENVKTLKNMFIQTNIPKSHVLLWSKNYQIDPFALSELLN